MDCIFCKIVSGEEESSKIYEDKKILAFMNLRPVNTGEFMIIPKEHIDHFIDISDELATHIIVNAQKLARNLQKKFQPQRVGYVVHGFGVPHAHLNVVPLNDPDDIVSQKFAFIENGEIQFDHTRIPVPPREELDRIAETLQENN